MHIHTHTHTHATDYCLLPLSPQLNTFQWAFAVVGAGHNYNKWFFFFLRLENNGGEAVKMSGRPSGEASVWVEYEKGDWQADHTDTLSLVSPPSFSLSLFCCHVRTNKSAYLCADTKVTKLDLSPGVHQHIGWLDICRDKRPDRTATQALCSYYLSIPTRSKSTALLTSVKYFQTPQICQTFDHLEM